tara:strand:+ start:274 stop:486 length:213 start_codon:yes stop_codon:yes gene_type:complete
MSKVKKVKSVSKFVPLDILNIKKKCIMAVIGNKSRIRDSAFSMFDTESDFSFERDGEKYSVTIKHEGRVK